VQAWSHRPVTPLTRRPGFAEAAVHAAAHADAGTFVVVWPPHESAALAALPATLHAADAVPEEPARSRRWTRILVLGAAGFASPPELAAAAAEPRQRFGDVELAPFAWAAGDRVLFDLRTDLGRARVRLTGAAGDLACDAPRDGGGFGCPGRPEWNRVAPERLRVLGEDWPCVWAHPVADHVLVLDLGTVQLGDRLELEAALSDAAASTPGGAPVQLELAIPGVATKVLWRSNQAGIERLVVPTPHVTAPVRLSVRTAYDGRRHLGVNLRIVEAR
jgi:hypothetical protein